MVRLKGPTQRVFVLHAKFQFHYGTIKSQYHGKSGQIIRYFNSTMVRLKVSQYETASNSLVISIPLWYD